MGIAYGIGKWDYSQANIQNEGTFDFNTVMLQAGYDFNKYIAVEGRYWLGIDTGNTDIQGHDFDLNVDAWGIYVKPQYPVTDALRIYGLLGYASISSAEYAYSAMPQSGDMTDYGDFNGFSWGVGASYAVSDNLEIFVDYVNMYDDTTTLRDPLNGSLITLDFTFSTLNVGLTYKF